MTESPLPRGVTSSSEPDGVAFQPKSADGSGSTEMVPSGSWLVLDSVGFRASATASRRASGGGQDINVFAGCPIFRRRARKRRRMLSAAEEGDGRHNFLPPSCR
jgi:hypothetical protein